MALRVQLAPAITIIKAAVDEDVPLAMPAAAAPLQVNVPVAPMEVQAEAMEGE